MVEKKRALEKLEAEIHALQQDWEQNKSVWNLEIVGAYIDQLPLLLHLYKPGKEAPDAIATLMAEGESKEKGSKTALFGKAVQALTLIPEEFVSQTAKRKEIQKATINQILLSLFLCMPDGESNSRETFLTTGFAVQSKLLLRIGKELLRPYIKEEKLRNQWAEAGQVMSLIALLLICMKEGGFDEKASEKIFNYYCPLLEEAIESFEWNQVAVKKGKLALKNQDMAAFFEALEEIFSLFDTNIEEVQKEVVSMKETVGYLVDAFGQQSEEIQQIKSVFSQSA